MEGGERKRVLFAVSDPHAVDLISRRMSAAGRWETLFASNANQALDQVSAAAVDVVAASTRLDGAPGDSLLKRVQATRPEATRLSLTEGDSARSVWTPPSFALQVPVDSLDPEALERLVERTQGLERVIGGKGLRELTAGLQSLPSLSKTYNALAAAFARPDSSMLEIGAIVESDPSLSVKVLHLVNSAFFGFAQRTTSIRTAVTYLGLEMLKAVALTAHLFDAAASSRTQLLSLEDFQAYSIRVARLARRFMLRRGAGDEAFTAGLLHDVGKIVLAVAQPAKFDEVLVRVAAEKRPSYEVEAEVFGRNHAEVGAFVLSNWNIPFSVVECAAFHYRPALVLAGPREVLAAVHAADALVGLASGDPGSQLAVGFIESVGLGSELAAWREAAREELSGEQEAG